MFLLIPYKILLTKMEVGTSKVLTVKYDIFFPVLVPRCFFKNVLITTIHTGKIGKNIIFYCKHFVTSFILTPESLKINVFQVFLEEPLYSDRASNDSAAAAYTYYEK